MAPRAERLVSYDLSIHITSIFVAHTEGAANFMLALCIVLKENKKVFTYNNYTDCYMLPMSLFAHKFTINYYFVC